MEADGGADGGLLYGLRSGARPTGAVLALAAQVHP